ncbi:hypothetical protein HDV57DRAFT_225359 [Trichoderma longibrachiatum]
MAKKESKQLRHHRQPQSHVGLVRVRAPSKCYNDPQLSLMLGCKVQVPNENADSITASPASYRPRSCYSVTSERTPTATHHCRYLTGRDRARANEDNVHETWTYTEPALQTEVRLTGTWSAASRLHQSGARCSLLQYCLLARRTAARRPPLLVTPFIAAARLSPPGREHEVVNETNRHEEAETLLQPLRLCRRRTPSEALTSVSQLDRG